MIGFNIISDRGNGSTIRPIGGFDAIELVSTGSGETRKVARPTVPGQILFISARSGQTIQVEINPGESYTATPPSWAALFVSGFGSNGQLRWDMMI